MTRSAHSLFRSMRLYVDTLRHTRPNQLASRLRRVVTRRWPGVSAWAARDGRLRTDALHCDEAFVIPLRYTHPPARVLPSAEAVTNGRFAFLHQTAEYPGRVRWHDRPHGRLWRFHLHFFDYAADLGLAFRATGSLRFWERLVALVDDWISANPYPRGDGWHPFTVSLRIVNWIRAYHLFAGICQANAAFCERWMRSLAFQARHLASHLEYDLTGNHLVKNGKALVFAGMFFPGEEGGRWTARGLRVLREEAAVQILDDGGHYERSPLYHAHVLADYLDVLALIPRGRPERAPLAEAARRMIGFLDGIVHPDGTLPLFNDCVLAPDPSPAALREVAGAVLGDETGDEQAGDSDGDGGGPGVGGAAGEAPAVEIRRFPVTGYFAVRAADNFLVFDCGPVCPEHLPAHAHCDLLSFELSVAGQRILTNCGTYQYEAGPWRDAFRGTAAHNTVQVNDEEQSAIWGSFRIGRIARVGEAVVRSLEFGLYLRGTYRGFDGNRIEHTRELFTLHGPIWLCLDTLHSRRPAETLIVRSRLHVPPEVQVRVDSAAVLTRGDGARLQVLPIGGEGFRVEPAWFSPEFGVRAQSAGLVLTARGGRMLRLGYVVAPESLPVEVAAFHSAEPWSVELRSAGRVYHLNRPP